MKTNVGGWDRNTRFIVGTAAITAGLLAPIPRGWKIALLALGATELTTAAARYCPVSELLGVDTRMTGPAETLRDAAENAVEDVKALA